MKYFIIILLIKCNFCLSQETFVNSYKDIYISEGLFYRAKDDQLFTGIIEFIKKNGVLRSKEVYKNGYLTNEFQYYNKSSKGKVYQEKVYYEKKIVSENSKFYIQKIINYHITGEVYSTKHFDLTGEKILEENFKDGELIYSCEFKDGKKDGKEFCTSKKCGSETLIYSKGKKIE